MGRIKRIVASIASSTLLTLGIPVAAGAVPNYTLFGEASTVAGNGSATAIQTVSDVNSVDKFGGIDFDIPTGTTFADLATLSTDFNITDDDCSGGSPRFQVAVDTDGDTVSDGNIWIYLGPSPNFTDCTTDWQNSGNLIGNTDDGRFDFTSLGGPLGTYADTPANVSSGEVLGIELVTDGFWSAAATGGDGEQTVLFDNTIIGGMTFDFEPEQNSDLTKEDCKDGGWMTMTDPGPFKNQGQCVSHFAMQQNDLNGEFTLDNKPTF